MHREKEVRYDSKTGEKILTDDVYADGSAERVVERPTIIKKRAGIGTWLGGLVVGVLLAAGGMAILANQQGSYQSAGAVVDQKVANAEQTARSTAEEAGDAAKTAGDKIEKATD